MLRGRDKAAETTSETRKHVCVHVGGHYSGQGAGGLLNNGVAALLSSSNLEVTEFWSRCVSNPMGDVQFQVSCVLNIHTAMSSQ